MEDLIQKYFCQICQNKCENCMEIQKRTENDVEIVKCMNYAKKEVNE